MVVCTGFLLYWRFPAEEFATYFQAIAARESPETPLLIQNMQPAFPLGIGVGHLELDRSSPDGTKNLFVADNLFLKADIISLLTGRVRVHFNGDLYGGEVVGSLAREGNDDSLSIVSELQLKGIQAGQVPLLMDIAGVDLKTVFFGNVNYSGTLDLPLDGTGKADFEFGEGRISLVKPLFGFTESVGIDNMTLTLSLKKGELHTRLIFNGPELSAELNGVIHLAADILQSEMDLKGKITGTSKFLADIVKASGPGMALLQKRLQDKAISFLLLGTVKEPRVRL